LIDCSISASRARRWPTPDGEPLSERGASLGEVRDDAIVHLDHDAADCGEAAGLEQALEDLDLGALHVELQQVDRPPQRRQERVDVDYLDVDPPVGHDVALGRVERRAHRRREGVGVVVDVQVQPPRSRLRSDRRLDQLDIARALEPPLQ
jgi:hypothetical protein